MLPHTPATMQLWICCNDRFLGHLVHPVTPLQALQCSILNCAATTQLTAMTGVWATCASCHSAVVQSVCTVLHSTCNLVCCMLLGYIVAGFSDLSYSQQDKGTKILACLVGMSFMHNRCKCHHTVYTTQHCSSPVTIFLQAQEALRRAKFKIAGRQKIVVSRNW